jgi:hypothetical protein
MCSRLLASLPGLIDSLFQVAADNPASQGFVLQVDRQLTKLLRGARSKSRATRRSPV